MTAYPVYSHKTLAFILCGLMLLLLSFSNRAEEIVGIPVETHETHKSLESSDTTSTSNFDQQNIDKAIETGIKEHVGHFSPLPPESSNSGFNEMLLIPIVSIIVVIGGGFLFIIALVSARYRALAQKRTQHQELIQKFLDAGRDVPDELLTDFDGKSQANLSQGIKETLVGLALMIFLTVLLGFDIGAVSLIVVAVGLSRLAIWKLSQPKKSV
jgi:hypothetical protein